MPLSEDERDRIRAQYEGQPGVGHHVERIYSELQNAEALGQEDRAATARAELKAFGYDTADVRARADAAAKRREAAAAKRDDSKGETAPEHEAPAGRSAQPRQTTATTKK